MLHGLGVRTGVDLDALVHVGDWICGVLGRESQSRVGIARLAGLRAAREAAATREQLLQRDGAAQALADLDRGSRAREVALCWPQLPHELLLGAQQVPTESEPPGGRLR